MTSVAGLLLAAGAGRRMGTPKSLVHDADGVSWLVRSISALEAGGCGGVTVVLGAGSDRATALLARSGFSGDVVVAEDWDEGMGASLRAGLRHLGTTRSSLALVSLVDLPDVGAEVVARLVGGLAPGSGPDAPDASDASVISDDADTDADAGGPWRTVLARAAYLGVPGHPVLLGRDHWSGVIDAASGDHGARDYLAAHEVTLVECGDLATGVDVDTLDVDTHDGGTRPPVMVPAGTWVAPLTKGDRP